MIASRRSFFLGASAFLAAPSIVRVSSLMPVSVVADWNIYPGKMWELRGDPLAQFGYTQSIWPLTEREFKHYMEMVMFQIQREEHARYELTRLAYTNTARPNQC